MVTWSGSPPASAIAVEPLADPLGAARIAIAAPKGAYVVVRDDAGALDSLRIAAFGAALTTPVLVGETRATANGQELSAAAPESVVVRPVVVVGRAGWEGKFIAAALEERAWPVIARFTVAPGVDVTQGALVLDTSRVSAVVALDSSVAALGAPLERFVRAGGGLVLAGTASLAANVASLAPGTLGARRPPPLPVPDTLDRASAGFYPVASLRRDAIAVEHRGEAVAVAVRRVGAGRVVTVGFDESWRWRMAGAPGADAAHREWWSQIVTSVAYASQGARTTTGSTSAGGAPLARLVQEMGPPRDGDRPPVQLWSPDPRILLALVLLLLLVEWASRRLRGAR